MNTPVSPNDLLPQKERSALLVIDIQERLAAAMPGSLLPNIVRNTCILVQTAQEFNLPILVSEQYPKGIGPTLPEIKAALGESVQPVEKVAFNCCDVPKFETALQALSADSFIVCGMETHICVLQTALGLLQRGRRVYIASDATSSRTKFNWHAGLNVLRQAGAVIGSTEMFAFGLLGAAGSESFKRISKLVK